MESDCYVTFDRAERDDRMEKFLGRLIENTPLALVVIELFTNQFGGTQ
jgi:hypothetical protein